MKDEKSPAPRLSDIREAIHGIRETVAELDFDAYCGSWRERRAVERGLEIISEASRHLPTELTDTHPHIPWRAIRAIGNLLRHEYGRVQDEIVWDVATNKLEALESAIDAMLRSLGENGTLQ
jgi:uncharacterized protein with HEPN domain